MLHLAPAGFPLCSSPEQLVEAWAGGNEVLPFRGGDTHRFLCVFKHFSGFFKAAFFFYAFSLEVPGNNLFQSVGIGSPLPAQNRARLFVLDEDCDLKRNRG